MVISLRLNQDESELIKAYADMHGISVSEFMRKSALEKIEQEHDLKSYEAAIEEYRKNPVTYSFENVERELGADVQG